MKNRPQKKNKKSFLASLVVIIVLVIGMWIFRSDDGTGNSDTTVDTFGDSTQQTELEYEFRKDVYLTEHFEKHGDEFDYETEEEYEEGANRVILSEDALQKTEEEDGDAVYYLEDTNEIVIVSKDGYIRTYFKPSDGIDYYNRQ